MKMIVAVGGASYVCTHARDAGQGFAARLGFAVSNRPLIGRLLVAIVALAGVLGPARSEATQVTTAWDGGAGNGLWLSANNWNPNGVPTFDNNANLQFAGTTQLSATNNSAAAITIRTLTFNTGAGAFTLSGTSVTLSNAVGVVNNSTNTQTISFSSLGLTNASTQFDATSGELVINSSITGNGFDVTGTRVTLNGSNSNTGANTVTSGALRITNASALGSTAAGTTVSSGAALELSGGISIGAETLSLNGTGISSGGALRNISGDNTYGGVITLAGATRINSDAGTLTINSAGSITGNFGLTFGGAGNIVLSDPFSPASATQTLTKNGTGNLTLSAVSTFTGLTTVSGGTLTFGITSALASGGITISGGSTLDIASFSDTVGTVTLTSGNIVGTTGVLTSTNTFALTSGTVSAILGATGFGVAQAASGTTVLSGSNTFTGDSTVAATGVLNIRSNTALGTTAAGTTVSSGGALELQGGITIGAEALSLSGSGISNTGALRNISGANSWGGGITQGAASRINSDSGTLTLSGTIGGAFGLTLGGAGDIVVSNTVAIGTGTLTKDGTGSLTLSAANTYTGATTISAGSVSASSIVVAAGASNLGNATSAVTLGAAGTEGILSYTGNSATYTRGFTIGGAGGGRLDVTTAGQTLTIATGTVGGTGMFTVGGSGNTSFTAALGHTGSLTKVGSGTLTLTAASTYSGSNVLSAGTVRVTSTTGLGVGGATDEVILSGARLELAADTATTFGPDIGYDSLVSASSTIAVDRTTAGAAVQHQMGVLTIGSQTLSVAAGANVTSGTATLAIAGQTVLTGSPTFDVAADTQLLLNGAISGTTDITKTGSGILTLGAGSGHANTTVSAGQLNVNFMSALGISTGTLSLAAGTSIGSTATSAVTVTNPKSIVLGSSLSFVGPTNLNLGTGTTTLTTSSTINVSTGTFTLGGNVVGSGLGITKTGTGTLVLSGLTAGAYTGNTTISDGELFLDGTSVLAGGTSTVVTVGSTAFLRIGASASSGSTTIVSRPGGVITSTVINSNVVFTQSGTLTTSDANINGTQTIDPGVDVAAPANYLGTIPSSPVADRIVIKDNATLRATTGFTLSPNQGILLQSGTGKLAANSGAAMIIESTVSGSGTLLKTGAGNVRLTGSNTYTGGTIIEQGILGITSDAALGAVSGSVRNRGGELVAAQTVSGGTISGVTISAARTVLIGNGTTSAFSAQTGLSLTYSGTIAEENVAGTAGNIRVGFAGAREGTVILTGSNTFQGSTLVHAGTLEIPTIADGGQASPLGRSSSAAGNLLLGNATLRFTGATGTTDRLFTIARENAATHNTTIEVTTGRLDFTNTGAIAMSGTGQRSLTLAGSGTGRLAATIGNDASNNATTVVKSGTGHWKLTGNNGYTGNTEINAGVLVLDGTNQTAGVIVAAGATLAGHGTMQAGTLSGNGLVEPGNSPGILTFLDVTASGSLSFAFEFTQANNPTWSSDTASGNDVLRLTDPDSPFNTALTATNVIDIYIGVTGPLAVGDTFRGGFFTDDNVDFYSFVQNADFNVWVRPQSGTGTRTYNGIEYVSGDQFFAPVSTFQVASADFSSGTVSNGYTLQFVAVPEPSTWVMGLMGLVGLVTPRLLRRRPTRG